MTAQDYLTYIGIEVSHIAAGLAGGIVRAVLRPGGSFLTCFSTTFVGVLSAAYATPLAKIYLGLTEADLAMTNALAFGIGLMGMSVAEGLIRFGKRWEANPTLPGPPAPPPADPGMPA